MSPPDESHDVVITVADENLADIEGLAQKLAAKGLGNANVLASAGLITGSAAPQALAGLEAEPGVTAVEAAGGVQIPPPDSEIQ